MATHIEPGCLALVHSHPVSSNNGQTVRVIRYLGLVPCNERGHPYWVGYRWETDTIFTSIWGPGWKMNHIEECCLLRIDGYQETEQETVEVEA